MAKKGPTVEAFMAALEHPQKPLIARVRAIILGANGRITEQVKWNAPSFCYGGDDRVTMRLHPPTQVQLILHRGAKVRPDDGFTFADDSGLLHWITNDRATVTLRSLAEVEAHEAALARLVERWMLATALGE